MGARIASHRHRLGTAAVLLAIVTPLYGACGSSSSGPPSGDDDAGSPLDASPVDATTPDGTPLDGTIPDADHEEDSSQEAASVCVPAPPIVTGSWALLMPQPDADAGAPTSRGYAGLALGFDGQRSLALLFGGGNVNSGLLRDTWAFDPSSDAWLRLSNQPAARGGMALAFAGPPSGTASGSFVMFGGAGSRYLADTWTYQGKWTNVCTPEAGACDCGPCPRAYHAMAFDSVRGQMVMFGGTDGTTPLGDTWVMSSDMQWQRRCASACSTDGGVEGSAGDAGACCTSPPARSEHAMAFDAARGVVVLFGGMSASGPLGDTWEWDGSRWTQRQPVHAPTARSGLAMTPAAAGIGVVAFGGTDANGLPANPLWTFDGVDWSPVVVAGQSPISRPFASMTYLAFSTSFLFGGGSAGEYNDAWTLTLEKAIPADGGCPEAGSADASILDGGPDAQEASVSDATTGTGDGSIGDGGSTDR